MNVKNGLIGLVVLALVAVGVWRTMFRESEPVVEKEGLVARREIKAIESQTAKVDAGRSARTAQRVAETSKKRVSKVYESSREVVDEFPDLDELSAEDRPLVKRIRKALDSDNDRDILACAEMAAKSKNPEVRSGMVSALQWCGRKAMPEMTMFMADPNDEVREEALDAWVDALQDIDSPTEKRDLLISSMKVISDRETLESLAMEISDLPNSYQIDVMTALIESDNRNAADVAREEYESLTDEAYTNPAAAEVWLAENPDDPIEVEDVIERDAAEGVTTPVTQAEGATGE